MSKLFKRVLALSLAAILALSLFPAAFAAETDASSAEDNQSSIEHGTGLLPSYPHGSTRPSDTASAPQGISGPVAEDDLPAKYDSRDYNWITPVRDQGNYNTCWTFSTAAACEAYMIKHHIEVGDTGLPADQNLNLSEYHMAYYTYSAAYDAEGMLTGDNTAFLSSANTNFLDHGGTGELVSYPLMRWTGLAAETEPALAYSAASYSGLGPDYAYQYNVAHLQSVKHFFGSEIEQVKRHIMEYGAGAMGVRISNQSNTGYHGGVNTQNGTICWKQSAVAYQDANFYYADHDVTVVGWDDNFSKDQFNNGYRPEHDGAWIVKNSWGTGSGDGGYYYVSYEDSATCASYISFFAVSALDEYDHNYQYDGSANYSSWEELEDNDAIAQEFIANGSETLEAVAIGLCGDNTNYTLRIYTDCTTSDPTAGTLALTQTGNIDYWGYQSIDLEESITLTPGQRFSVVFTFTGDDILPLYDTTYSDNQYYNMQVTHMPHPNTAYLKHSGDTSWTDMSGDRNYRVKAYTKDIPEDPIPMTLSCVALGNVYQTISGTAGEKINLPATAPAADGWTFQGWVIAPLDETTEQPSFYKPGASYKLTAAVSVIYALYMRAEPINAPVTYELLTGVPKSWEGKYVFTCMNTSGSTEYAMYGVAGGTNIENASSAVAFANSGITRSGTTLSNVPERYVFEIASTLGGMSVRSVEQNSYLASVQNGSTSTSYYFYALSEYDAGSCSWTFELDDDEWYLKNNNSGLIPYVGVSGSTFAMTRYGGEFKYYKQNPTETYYYATNIVGGEHTHELTYTAASAPTCGAAGNTEYWFCALCGKYFSDADANNEITLADTVLAPTGAHVPGTVCTTNNNGTHYYTCTVCGAKLNEDCTYEDVVVAPTETEQGYTEHTCVHCGYSFRDSYTAPLSGGYTVSFTVPAGVAPVADMICPIGESITLPTAGAPEDYTFLGWVLTDYNNVTEQPAAILTGSYEASANITLKALYSWSEAGSGTSYQLVTETLSDWTGNYVITKGNSPLYVMAGLESELSYETEANGGAVAFESSGITLDGTELKNVSAHYSFAVAPISGTNYYSIQNAETQSFLILRNSTLYSGDYNSSNSRWGITIGSDNVATISNPYSSYSNVITFAGSSFWGNIFQVMSSASDIFLWRETASGTTYYTTIIGEEHVHTPAAAVEENRVEPTCTAAGSYDSVVYCSECGEELSRETVAIPALGHQPGEAVQENYVEPTATVAGGYDMVVYCQRCNAELSREHTELPATGPVEPQYNGSLQLYYSFSLGKEITPVYTITNASVSSYVDFWVVVEKDGAEPVTIAKADMTGTSAFKASYTGIAAKEMGVNFTATLYAKDANGNIFYGPSVTKTIRNELVTRLKNTSNPDKTRKLCADMLNYGAAAQVYFGYDTDNLVNADVEYIHDYETTGVPEAVNHQATEGTGGMLYPSASLSNRVVLNLKGAMTGGASVKLNVMDEEGNVLDTLDTTAVSANLFEVNFDQVGAKDMRTIYKFQFVDEGGVSADSRILTWSVESFVAQKLASNEPGSATYELARALLIYGDSAKEYLGN